MQVREPDDAAVRAIVLDGLAAGDAVTDVARALRDFHGETVVVNDGVDVVVADPSVLAAVLVRGGTASGSPASAFGNAAELLDIHVDQLAGTSLWPKRCLSSRISPPMKDTHPPAASMRQRTLSVASAQLRAVNPELKKDLRAPYWAGKERMVN